MLLQKLWLDGNYIFVLNPKEFDDPQVFDEPKGISIGSMDFDNPKVYGDTAIFDGLVLIDGFS